MKDEDKIVIYGILSIILIVGYYIFLDKFNLWRLIRL